MAFCKISGLSGKLYLPERSAGRPKKHDCQDCYTCQRCSDDRCRICRRRLPDGRSVGRVAAHCPEKGTCP